MISAVCWVPRHSIRATDDDVKEDDEAALKLAPEEELRYRGMYESYISAAPDDEINEDDDQAVEKPPKGTRGEVADVTNSAGAYDSTSKKAKARNQGSGKPEDSGERHLSPNYANYSSGTAAPAAKGSKLKKIRKNSAAINKYGEGSILEEEGGGEKIGGQKGKKSTIDLKKVEEGKPSKEAVKRQSGKGKKGKSQKGKQGSVPEDDPLLAPLNLSAYDDDEDPDDRETGVGGDADDRPKASLITTILGALQPPIDPDDDPYITLPDGKENVDDSDDDSAMRVHFRENDCVIVATRAQDDMFSLEFWLYESGEDGTEPNLFVGQELILPAFPLCLTWAGVGPRGGQGSYVAVGTMDPHIEVFDVNDADAMEPCITLLGRKQGGKKGKKSGSSVGVKRKLGQNGEGVDESQGHTAGVMSLSWNSNVQNVLASGSADKSVGVWDILSATRVATWRHHVGKVQCVTWNRHEPNLLLTGSYDQHVSVLDVRQAPSSSGRLPSWNVESDVEIVRWWAGSAGSSFVVATENGLVRMYDARKGPGAAALFTVSASDGATSSVSFCEAAPQLMVTASTDGVVKLWDVQDGKPQYVSQQNTRVGAVFSVEFSADLPYLVAVGGSEGQVSVWDILATEIVVKKYGNLLEPGRRAGDMDGDGEDDNDA